MTSMPRFSIGAQSMGGHAQRNPTLFGLQPETLLVQVWQKAAAGPVVRMRYAVARGGTLASDFADADINLSL